MTVNDQQVGGSHYKATVQHWDICAKFDIPYILGCMTKYLYRYPEKNGIEDLQKAAHYGRKWIELFYSPVHLELRPEIHVSAFQLNVALQEFAASFHADVNERLKELTLDIMYNWRYLSDTKFISYVETIEEIIDASNNQPK